MIYNIKINIKEFTTNNQNTNDSIVNFCFKILSDYLQIISCLTNIPISYPKNLNFKVDFFSNFINLLVFLNPMDCIFYDTHLNVFSTLFQKIILINIFGFALPFFSVLSWNLFDCFHPFAKKNKKMIIWISIIIICYNIQPTLINSYFNFLFCIQIDGTLRMKKYLKEVCWEGDHLQLFYFWILPNLLLWMFVLPFFLFKTMKFSIKERTNSIAKGKMGSLDLKLNVFNSNKIFSFCLLGLKEEKYYWEFLLFLRKYLIIVLSIFPISGNDMKVNLVLIAIILFIFLILQILLNPFSHKQFNKFAFICNSDIYLTSVFLIFFSLLKSDSNKSFVFLLMITLNLLFLSLLFTTIYWSKKSIIFSKFHAFFHFIGSRKITSSSKLSKMPLDFEKNKSVMDYKEKKNFKN